jgi:hypothetical protein
VTGFADGDGFDVGAPVLQNVVSGPALPAGLACGGYDEDDDDPSVIETEDFDDLLELLLLDG